MKHIFFSLLILIATISCQTENQSEPQKDTQKDSINNENTQDTLLTIEDNLGGIENQNNENEFSTVEDYSSLNTKEKLNAKFDKIHLEDGVSFYAEGTVELPHTILTNPNNGHIIKFVWNESNPNELSSIEVSYVLWNENYESLGTQKVLSDFGIYSGMPIKELREWNGKDFMFSGFGWDYAGGIFAQPETKIYDCKTKITLDLEQDINFEKYTFLLGDIELSTADEATLNAPIVISKLTLFL